MIAEEPARRPTADEVLSLCSFCPSMKSKVSEMQYSEVWVAHVVIVYIHFSQAQLCKELNEEKFKNEVLTR